MVKHSHGDVQPRITLNDPTLTKNTVIRVLTRFKKPKLLGVGALLLALSAPAFSGIIQHTVGEQAYLDLAALYPYVGKVGGSSGPL